MRLNKDILIVDDNRGVLSALTLFLRPYFNKIHTLNSPVRILEVLRAERPHCVLLDMNFRSTVNNGNEGLFYLSEILRFDKNIPVVLFTAYADIDLAVRGIKEGAADFIVKPWDNGRLLETLQDACQRNRSLRSNKSAMLWGDSDTMVQLRDFVAKIAPTDANVLITGENGTGKDMLAREIHMLSRRNNGPLITVDMGAVTETLFESELFGHVKGAYTGALSDRKGKISAAHQGTLFMDEIGNLPRRLQSKLLSTLQNRMVVPVGSNEPQTVDVRLICATNSDLDKMIAEGTFREDLLYRINTIHLHLPPLRERRGDIVPLAQMFVSRFCSHYMKPEMMIDADAKAVLLAHNWYGNIRELQSVIEKAVIMSDGNDIRTEHITFSSSHRGVNLNPRLDEISTLADMERHMIETAIDKHGGNLSAVARQLGITRQTLYNKMKHFGL